MCMFFTVLLVMHVKEMKHVALATYVVAGGHWVQSCTKCLLVIPLFILMIL